MFPRFSACPISVSPFVARASQHLLIATKLNSLIWLLSYGGRVALAFSVLLLHGSYFVADILLRLHVINKK